MGGLVEEVNVRGVRTVAAAALEAGVGRLVHCSSVHAFDLFALRGQDVVETSLRATDAGLPAYDRSKAAGECQLRQVIEAGLDAVIVNPTGVIGPRDEQPSRMGHFFQALALGRLPATVAGGFDWVDVRDVVAALLAAEERGRTGENYLIGGHLLSTRELAAVASSVTGVAPPRFDVPLWFARAWSPAATLVTRRFDAQLLYTSDTLNALASEPHVNCAKAERELGHHPRPIVETVTDLYAYFDSSSDR
jgi:dihydroflavonol-4-reductase